MLSLILIFLLLVVIFWLVLGLKSWGKPGKGGGTKLVLLQGEGFTPVVTFFERQTGTMLQFYNTTRIGQKENNSWFSL